MESPAAMERRDLGAAEIAPALAATRPLEAGHDARAWVEELLLDLGPTADVLDREQLRPGREVEPTRSGGDDRPVTVLRKDLLRGCRAQELQERLRFGLVLRGRRNRDRVLDQDRRLRDDELNGLSFLLCEHRLVLIREEDIATARKEGLQPFARARRLCDNVLPELAQIVDGLLRRLAGTQRTTVGGHDVPASPTRRERVRRDHLNARLEQVVPGLQLLRVTVADDELLAGLGVATSIFARGGRINLVECVCLSWLLGCGIVSLLLWTCGAFCSGFLLQA